jgi:MerR family transcriptional regulator, heat shock protein HspR
MVNLDWQDQDRALFGISVVAELAGLHPHTLRAYEREGLLSPARTGGGTRRYSLNDLARLQDITSLSAEGFNLAGIKRILAMQEETRRLRDEVTRLRQQLGDPDDSPARHEKI